MPLDVLHSDLSREAGADSVGSGETHNKRRSYKRMRGQICAVMVFALYVLVGLTRPLDVLHSDLSREARADLVGKSFWRKHNINSNQKQKHENTKRIQKTKTTNGINENKFRSKRKHEKQNHDNNNMVPAAKNKKLVLLRCLQ